MAESTKIQWTTHTFNPWIGCTKVHEGCAHCYAEADMDHRRKRAKWGPHGTRSRTSDDYWKQPLKWDREAQAAGERRRVFCASLADIFEDWQGPIVDARGEPLLVDGLGAKRRESENVTGRNWSPLTMDDLRRDLFGLIDRTPNLDWLLLTKRPENVRRMWPAAPHMSNPEAKGKRLNVWLGTSVSNQPTADRMLPPLIACRDLCPVLFASAEPLLGELDLAAVRVGCGWHALGCACSGTGCDHGKLDWVIVGGESTQGKAPARRFYLGWARSLVAQCREWGAAPFIKQMGSSVWDTHPSELATGEHRVTLRDSHGGDPSEWPELFPREFPAAPGRQGA
jgi:protein gp37